MGCGASGSGDHIEMKKTKLAEIDEFFDDAQDLLDKIYAIKDPIEENGEQLMEASGFSKVECAHTGHATVGTVYAVAANADGNVDGLVDIKAEPPFLEIKKEGSKGELLDSIEALTAYLNALASAGAQIPPLAEKSKEIAEKAPDIPKKAKDAASNSTSLGAMDKYVTRVWDHVLISKF